MKQGIRLLIKPSAFINQLQWSSRHWLLMGLFIGIAVVETQVGSQQALYSHLANVLERSLGVSHSIALFIVTSLRLSLLLGASFGLASLVWLIGNLFGRKTSKRVLFRRLAIVFTVILGGYTLQHFSAEYPAALVGSLVLFAWGLLLGYFAVREQFGLTHPEAAVIGLFAVFLVISSWHYTNHLVESAIRGQIEPIAKHASPSTSPRAR